MSDTRDIWSRDPWGGRDPDQPRRPTPRRPWLQIGHVKSPLPRYLLYVMGGGMVFTAVMFAKRMVELIVLGI